MESSIGNSKRQSDLIHVSEYLRPWKESLTAIDLNLGQLAIEGVGENLITKPAIYRRPRSHKLDSQIPGQLSL